MTASGPLLVVFTVALVVVFPPASSQYFQPGLCTSVCYCSKEEATVDCGNQDRIQGVPTNLPIGTQKLIIQGGVFPASTSHLTSKNLTGLTHLVSLRIVNSKLRSIDSRAFLGMTSLRDLDLSKNELTRIEPHTFYGLNLKTLYLQEQSVQPDPYSVFAHRPDANSLTMTGEAFLGLSASRIELQKNSISDIPFSLFSKVDGLTTLILSNNKIRHLGEKYADYFDKDSRMIDLTGNPLECSCKLAWLANRVRKWEAKYSTMKTTCMVDPRIGGPGSTAMLVKLSADHLCPSSRIQSIGVDITPVGKAATLSCTAIAYSRLTSDEGRNSLQFSDISQNMYRSVVRIRPPSVAWKYVEAGQLRQVTGMPSDLPQSYEDSYDLFEDQKTMTTVQLNVSLSQTSRKFTCFTWDERKNEQEVFVTVRGPTLPPLIESSDHNDLGAASSKKNADLTSKEADSKPANGAHAYPHSNFLFQKQYTLLEMIGAVIGTFLFTLIVLLLGSRCMVFLRQRSMSRPMSKDVGRVSVYDISKNSDNGGGNNTIRMNGTTVTNGAMQAPPPATYDGISGYPLYNHYLASQPTAGTYPANFAPSVSLVASPNCVQPLPISAKTPLLHQSSLLLHPGMGGGTQPLLPATPMWAAPPGSAYSGAGSHEYDVPRGMDTSQMTSELASTLHRNGRDQDLLQPHQQQSVSGPVLNGGGYPDVNCSAAPV